MEQLGVLQRILNDIALTMEQGGTTLYPVLLGYLGLFTLFALLLTAYGIVRGGAALALGVGTLVRLALVVLALERWPWFLGGLRDIAITFGLLATGNLVDVANFLDPGGFLRLGLTSGAVLWKAFQNNLGWTSFVTGFAYLLAWVAYGAAFAVMAYKVFWWQVELLIASLGGLCLLPTLMFRPTAFVAAGVLSYAANTFARFLLGALLAGALWKHLGTLTEVATPVAVGGLPGLDMQIQSAFVAVATAWVLAACFLALNRLAGMLTSGIPGMAGGSSMGAFLRTVAAGGAALMTGGAAAATGMLGAGRVGAGAVQGLVGAANAGASMSNYAPLGVAARGIYAGARAGMSGGAQARLGQLMAATSATTTRQGQRTVQQLMGASRSTGHDQQHGGVRR